MLNFKLINCIVFSGKRINYFSFWILPWTFSLCLPNTFYSHLHRIDLLFSCVFNIRFAFSFLSSCHFLFFSPLLTFLALLFRTWKCAKHLCLNWSILDSFESLSFSIPMLIFTINIYKQFGPFDFFPLEISKS